MPYYGRAEALSAVVRQDEAAGGTRHRSGEVRQDKILSRQMDQGISGLDGEHPRLVHIAPDMVGASYTRILL